MKTIDLQNAKCTKLSFDATVNLLKGEDKKELTGFELEGYTGAVVQRWWGKLVIDLNGIESKQKMPVFKNHDHNEIVGFSTKVTKTPSFTLNGLFSKSTKASEEVRELAGEGFPWQASIGVSPKIITEIKEGSSLNVNNQIIDGPAEIWTESEVYETSFVPIGADGSTSATVFSHIEEVVEKRVMIPTEEEELNMDMKDLTLEELNEKRPDLVDLIKSEATKGHDEALKAAKSEGAEGETLRIKAVHEQSFPGQEKIVNLAMFDGKSQAGDVAIKINAANIQASKQAALDRSSDAPDVLSEASVDVLKEEPKTNLTDDQIKEKFENDPKIRAEFIELEIYSAYVKGAQAGAFKELKK